MAEDPRDGEHRVDRYQLHLQVSAHGVVQLWQGWDPSLERSVSVRLLPADDPRARAVAEAARRASMVDERRLVAVLDVIPDARSAGFGDGAGQDRRYLAVVNEWVEGRTLTDILEEREGEPLSAAEALPIMRQVALAIASSQAKGVAHGRLRPVSLLLADPGSPANPLTLVEEADAVRIRGLAVDAALWPQLTPGAVDPDVHGVGCLLYAAVTGRWPEGLVDGLSPAPRTGGRTPRDGDRLLPPSQVVADVPSTIDEICMRAIDPRVAGESSERRYGPAYPDVASLAQALTRASGPPSSSEGVGVLGNLRRPPRDDQVEVGATRPPLSLGRRVARGVGRVAVAAVAVVAVAGLALFGLRLLESANSPWGVSPNPVRSDVLTSNADTELAAAALLQPGEVPGEISPVKAIDHDPFGYDEQESPDQVDAAIDADMSSAWNSDVYYTEDLEGKPGVGLVLDLGSAQSVSAVRLELVGSGSSVKILLASQIARKPSKWTPLAEAEGVGTAIELRAPRPVVGRYVLIWFTGLPLQDGVYQGGLRDVTVFA